MASAVMETLPLSVPTVSFAAQSRTLQTMPTQPDSRPQAVRTARSPGFPRF